MTKYRLEDFKGESILIASEKPTLNRYEKDSNSIYLSSVESDYPMLHILLKGDQAAIHYFENKDALVFQSKNGNKNIEGEMATFTEDEASQEIELPSESVISYKEATVAANEFIKTNTKPKSVDWIEL